MLSYIFNVPTLHGFPMSVRCKPVQRQQEQQRDNQIPTARARHGRGDRIVSGVSRRAMQPGMAKDIRCGSE
jgi:hypothetical protein